MTQLGQAQVGLLRSTPKLTRINGDDNLKVIWRNMGNNHAYPFVWGVTATVVSGATTATLASGVKFHGFDLATYASVIVTPNYDAGACYVTKDTTNNVITLTCATAATTPYTVNVMYMLGEDPDVTGLNCGTWSGNIKQDLP